MNDDQLLRYSRHILLPEIGIEGAGAICRRARAGRRRGRAGLAGRAVPRGGRRRPDHALPTATRSTSPTCSARSCTAPPTIGTPKAESARGTLAAINPGGRASRPIAARVGAASSRAGRRRRRRARLQRQLRDPPRDQPRLRRARAAAGLGRGDPLRRPDRGVRSARSRTSPCYHCLFPEGERVEDMRCAVMGVFAPLVGIVGATQAAEALKLARRRRRVASPAGCCCSTRWRCEWRERARDARSRLPGLRGRAMTRERVGVPLPAPPSVGRRAGGCAGRSPRS